MATINYGFPTITENMTADIVRDQNALAVAVDEKLKEVDNKVGNIDFSSLQTQIDGKADKTEVTAHLGDNTKHITVTERTSWNNAVNDIGTKSNLLTTNKTNIVSAVNELFTNVSDGKNVIATAITDKGQSATGSDTFNQLATKIIQIQSVLTGNAIASNVLSGKTFYSTDPNTKLTGTIPSKSAQTYTPRSYNQAISSGQYLSGAQTILGDSNLTASNIKKGISIFGISGSVDVSSLGGKFEAKGTVISSSSAESFSTVTGGTNNTYYITVSGLSFIPSVIVISASANSAQPYESFGMYFQSLVTQYPDIVFAGVPGAVTTMRYKGNTGLAYVNSTGFRIPVFYSKESYDWIAFS